MHEGMSESEYYNMAQSNDYVIDEATNSAKRFSCCLMISHLHHSHGRKARELAKMFGFKVKEVQEIISGKFEDK